MQASQNHMIKHPSRFISFKDRRPHTVTLLADKEVKIPSMDGVIRDGVEYSVIEDGNERSFRTASIVLIGKLAKCNPNDRVIIQMITKNNRTSYDVKRVLSSDVPDVPSEDIPDEDIPIVEDESEQDIPPEDVFDANY